MHKVLVIDEQKCTGCELCVLHCSFRRTQTFNRTKSAVNIIRREVEGLCIPSMCQHCQRPLCLYVCPKDAISKDKETKIVRIDTELCNNCRRCIMVCPFGAPAVDLVTREVFKCDQCDGDPVCVKVCPTEAIQYVEADRAGLTKRRQGMEKLTTLRQFVMAKAEGGKRE